MECIRKDVSILNHRSKATFGKRIADMQPLKCFGLSGLVVGGSNHSSLCAEVSKKVLTIAVKHIGLRALRLSAKQAVDKRILPQ
eukprot:6463350-Amphidinium_carterae.3